MTDKAKLRELAAKVQSRADYCQGLGSYHDRVDGELLRLVANALPELLDENDKLKDSKEAWCERWQGAFNKLALARKALEFYAKQSSYDWDLNKHGTATVNDVQKDEGRVAREALKALDGEQK